MIKVFFHHGDTEITESRRGGIPWAGDGAQGIRRRRTAAWRHGKSFTVMKKVTYFILALGILFLGYVVFFHSPGVGPEKSNYRTIICFGDSLTYGTGASQGMDYPSQLSLMLNKPVINAGVPGDTTGRALRRLERDVLSKNPDIVLITLGGNDLKNGVSKDTAFRNLRQIVESIQEQGVEVIIGGLKFPLRDRGYAKGFQELAEQTGAVLIPDIFQGIMGNLKLMSDPIHPNDAGYKIIAQRFHAAISP